MELLLLLLSLLWRTQDDFLSNSIAYTGAANFHWICMGDLNKILNQSKKKGGLPISIWATRLWDFMDDSQAMDLGSEGLSFIWTNKRKGRHNIRQIIDRVLIYVDWFHFFFPSATVRNSKYFTLDHARILLTLNEFTKFHQKPFRM